MGLYDGKLYVPMNVHLDDDPKIIRAGERAEVLYLWGLRFAKKTMLDGFIDADQLRRFPYAGVAARAKKLIEVGLWEHADGGYRIVAWGKWNEKTADTVRRSMEAHDAGMLGNHRRHHLARSLVNASCPYCNGRAHDPGSREAPEEEEDDDARVPDRPPDEILSGTRSPTRDEIAREPDRKSKRSEAKRSEAKGEPDGSPPSAPRGIRTRSYDLGEALLREWCESCTPHRRVAGWPGKVKILAGFLDSGHDPDDLRAALEDAPVISTDAVQFALGRLQRRTTASNGRASLPPGAVDTCVLGAGRGT